jgi:von Willebrand factor type A domain
MAYRWLAGFSRSLLPVPLALVAAVVACGSSKGPLNGTGDDDADGGGGGGDDGTGSSSGSGTFGGDGGDDSGDLTMMGACAYSTSKGQSRALDVYIMLDQSASMIGPKWTGVTAAINSFVAQPLTGVSVGIQYFALNFASCTASDYATPEVEIAPLPGVASKITMSLAGHIPSTGTPTMAAEQGAVQHAQAWAKAHPDDAVVVILATDGDPDLCTLTPDPLTPVEQAAAVGVNGTPKILTFVIGVGTDTANLNAIAAAGGTTSAFIVDTSMAVDTQFLAALNKIRGSALGCQYKIPPPMSGSSTDFTKVNVQFTTTGNTKTIFPQVTDKAACPASGNAWYYDNNTSPTVINLCTTACGAVSAGGEVDVLTGCNTITK